MDSHSKDEANAPDGHPTSSDLSMMMQSMGYEWSNEAQVYFHNWDFYLVPHMTAEHIYRRFYGNKPYQAPAT